VKATGIVRRIDELGRIVIPKEIRRSLRIREGAPPEIYVDQAGGLILRKYSPVKELADIAQDYVDSLTARTSAPSFVLDHDQVVAASGVPREEWIGRETPQIAITNMDERRKSVLRGEELGWPFPLCALAPIVAEGDCLGAVVVASVHGADEARLELKLAETAAGFLARQIEP